MNAGWGLSLVPLVMLLGACSKPQVDNAPPVSPWVAIAKGQVGIEGGVIHIAAPRPGIIHEVAVEEGAEVKTGAVLARIDDREAQLALRIRERQREEVRRGIELLEIRHAAQEREVKRLAQLPNDDVVSQQERDNAQDLLRTLSAELAQQQAALATVEAQVAADRLEVEQHIVRAPLDGRIVRRQARPGDGASTLNVTPLFIFAPEGPRIVRADLEEHFVSLVAPDQAAEVVLEADESKVYKARVLRLGQVFGSRPETDDPNEKQDVRVIECVLALDAPELRIGQRVLVRIARKAADIGR